MRIICIRRTFKNKNTIELVKGALNPELQIEGVLLSMYDKRLRLSTMVIPEYPGKYSSTGI